MTSEQHLLIGTLLADGTVDPTPVLARVDASGRVTAHRPFDWASEPAATICRGQLLDITSLTLCTLPKI